MTKLADLYLQDGGGPHRAFAMADKRLDDCARDIARNGQSIAGVKTNYANLEERVRKIERSNIGASLTKAWEEIEAIKERHRREEIPFGEEPEHSVEINGTTITGTAEEIEAAFPDAIDEALAEPVKEEGHVTITGTVGPIPDVPERPPMAYRGNYEQLLEICAAKLHRIANERGILLAGLEAEVHEVRCQLDGAGTTINRIAGERDAAIDANGDSKRLIEEVTARVKELRIAYATGGLHLIKSKAKALFDLFREEG